MGFGQGFRPGKGDTAGDSSIDGDLSVTGDTTLGNASSDATTARGSLDISDADGATYGLKLASTLVTATAAELNILDGVTATAAELNILDGVTSTAAELNILDGVTATAAELNYVDVTTAGTAQASKAVVLDANKNISTLGAVGCGAITSTGNISGSGDISFGGDSSLKVGPYALSQADIGFLDGITAGTAAASKAVVLDASSDVTGLRSVTGSGNAKFDNFQASTSVSTPSLVLGGTAVSSTATELNYLGGFTEAVIDKGSDSLAFWDSNVGAIRRESVSDFLTAVAGAGISVSGDQLVADGGGAPAAVVHGDTLTEGFNYLTGALAGNAEVTLPASPAAGDKVHFKAAGGLSDSVYVDVMTSGSHTIDGQDSVRLESPHGAISFFYAETNLWKIW